MPTIDDLVLIDGTTAVGFSGTPLIVLDGNDLAADGLVLTPLAGGSTIRGLVITNFGGDAIEIQAGSDGSTISGNYLGRLDATGSDAGAGFANGQSGVRVFGASNTIGGTAAGSGNVIAGNLDNGITISGAAATGNLVRGNLIGTDAAGTTEIGNGVDGILIDQGAANNIVGGTTASARNVISGHTDDGIEIDLSASGNIIRGNYIGTDITGTLNFGNGSDGILINASVANNQIGGVAAGAGNVIAFSGGIGVDVINGSNGGNSVLGNSIHSSGGLGIDLVGDGVTANDAGDPDLGSNDLQNFPVLSSVTSSTSTTTFAGSLNSTASTSFRIEFFSSPAATGDATGYGEGRVYLGSTTVTTDGAGDTTFSVTLAVTVAGGDVVTATATVDLGGGSYGSTSEFGQNIACTFINSPPVNTVPGSAVGERRHTAAHRRHFGKRPRR